MSFLNKKYYLKTFVIALIMGCVMIIPFIISMGGAFYFYGDLKLQHIPFNKMISDVIKSGDLGWCWQGDMGLNFLGSFGSYLANPFFWLILLVPSEYSHFLIGPIIILKLAVTAMLGSVYIRRFVKDPKTAVIGGLLFGFSGYSIYNIYFYAFHDSMCVFILILIALEEAVVCKRRGVFALTVAFSAMLSPYFFYEHCIFLVIYFISRIAMSREFRINVKDFFCLAFESVIGFAMSAVLFLPMAYSTMSLSRVGDLLSGWDFMAYSDSLYYLRLVFSMFLPTETPHMSTWLPTVEALSSAALYLPFFAMSGVIAVMHSRKKNWVKPVLLVCLVMAFIPGLNAVFSMMNEHYYCRWFYMPELMLCLATAMALDDESCDLRFGARVNFGVAAALCVLYLLTPFACVMESYDAEGNLVSNTVYKPRFLYYNFGLRAFILVVIALVSGVVLLRAVQPKLRKNREKFLSICAVCVVVISVGTGIIELKKAIDRNGLVDEFRVIMDDRDLKLEDDKTLFRVDYPTFVNINLVYGLSSPSSFFTVLPQSTFDFYTLIKNERTQLSLVNNTDYCFNALTETKYILVHESIDEEFSENYAGASGSFTYTETRDGFRIYKNDYILPAGYAYERYILDRDLSDFEEDVEITGTMMKAAVLDKDTAEKLSDLLTPMPVEEAGELEFEEFKQELAERSKLSVNSFEKQGSSFTATTDYDRERLVVFSVPYEGGWSAEIGGEPAEIYTINGCFMAVRVPAGEQTIRFTYKTPLLAEGAVISAVSAAALAVYAAVIYLVLKKRPKKFSAPAEEKGVSLHSSYISDIVTNGEKNV